MNVRPVPSPTHKVGAALADALLRGTDPQLEHAVERYWLNPTPELLSHICALIEEERPHGRRLHDQTR